MSWWHLARRVRHSFLLERCNGLWDLLRPAYRRLLDIRHQGVPVILGGTARMRIPAEFVGGAIYESYEPATVRAATGWFELHPDGVFLDIGCAIGVYSALALAISTGADVYAFDSDINSLQSTRRFCRYTERQRLTLIWGFLSDAQIGELSLIQARELTTVKLADPTITGEPGTNRYVCLGPDLPKEIPVWSVDSLLDGGAMFLGRPILIKCDVEGAELLVLQGAKRVLSECSPDLLLSVHPSALPQFGHSTYDIKSFLEENGYGIDCIAIDHEEHWWCSKTVSQLIPSQNGLANR